jgi:aryl-alcohol dehydrogenase-like predicted oxidoreductase
MRYRKLGSCDLQVSEISLGSWLTYSGGAEFDQTRACTDAAFEAGINFFDTANVYGRGAAETAWGDILSGRPRDSYVLATKVWGQMSDDPGDRGLSAAHIAKEIDASLGRLQTDYVDLYQAHRFDPDVPIEETIEALQQVVASGNARYLGFSEWTPEQIQAAIDIAGADLFVSSQPQYSMLWQAPEAEPAAVRRPRDLPDRVVAARPGPADRQVPPGGGAASRLARGQQRDELRDGAAARRRAASRGRPAAPGGRAGRALAARA